MSDTKRIHIQGVIEDTPSTDGKNSYSRYGFSVRTYDNASVKIAA